MAFDPCLKMKGVRPVRRPALGITKDYPSKHLWQLTCTVFIMVQCGDVTHSIVNFRQIFSLCSTSWGLKKVLWQAKQCVDRIMNVFEKYF